MKQARLSGRANQPSASPAIRSLPSGLRRLFLPIGVLVVVSVLIGAFLGHASRSTPEGTARVGSGSRGATADLTVNCAQPWGELEIKTIMLERPDDFVPDLTHYSARQSWFFSGYTQDRLLGLLRGCDLTPLQHAALEDTNHWSVETNGIYLRPDLDLVLQLSKQARRQIYLTLAILPDNPYQNGPFVFPKERSQEWFEESGLSPDTVALVNQLLYEREPMLCFSDMDILTRLKSEEEKHRLVRTLSRVPAVLAYIRLTSPTNVNDLVRYWSRARPAKDIEPLLESMARTTQDASISVSYLLPPFARLHLYTFPEATPDVRITGQDCFWSAMNFFNSEPDDRLLDPEHRSEVMKQDYFEVAPPAELGDILLLVNRQGAPVHACVHVAGDVVFTKNGATKFSPWILMRLPDMLKFYDALQPLRQVWMRKRDHT
jgi:hypothetical protein